MARILIIEDDNVMGNVIKINLEEKGYETIEASDGAEAIELLSKEHVDLIITDIFMPKMDGIELIRELLKKNPDAKIVAISGGGITKNPDIYVESALAHGAIKGFIKPIDMSELISTVQEALA